MTNDNIAEAKKNYLLSLKDPQVSSAVLLDLLDKIELHNPELLTDFHLTTAKSDLDLDPISWNAQYFSRHMLLAEHNFSRKRIEHLIKVREHLNKQGVKGFVPLKSQPKTESKSGHAATANYTPSVNLQKFVQKGDLPTIRTALRLELNDNSLTSSDLHSAMNWAKTKVPGLFEAYTEKAFARSIEPDTKLWSYKYYDTQTVYLKTNFCEERLQHLIEVRELLRQQGIEGFVAIPPKPRTSSAQTDDNKTQHKGNQSQHEHSTHSGQENNTTFKTALMIGGAVAALIVLLISMMR